jgi:hypothetical protein
VEFTILETVPLDRCSSREIFRMPSPEINFFMIRSRCGAGTWKWISLVAFGFLFAALRFMVLTPSSLYLGPESPSKP